MYPYIIGSWFGFLIGSYTARSDVNTRYLSHYNYQNVQIEKYKKFIRTHNLENQYDEYMK